MGNDFTRMKNAFPTWETILQRKRMEQKNKIFNLGTFFCLYIAQTIPMSFFSTVIPVMMRQENFSLSAIGLLQLIKLPWILKFLWSPMVDRHARTTGDYKRWIFSSELIYAVLNARQQAVPSQLFEQQQQHASPDHRAAETPHRLHTVHQALVFPAKGKDSQRIGRNILGGRGYERYDDQGDNGIEIRFKIKESDGKDQDGITADWRLHRKIRMNGRRKQMSFTSLPKRIYGNRSVSFSFTIPA